MYKLPVNVVLRGHRGQGCSGDRQAGLRRGGVKDHMIEIRWWDGTQRPLPGLFKITELGLAFLMVVYQEVGGLDLNLPFDWRVWQYCRLQYPNK